MLKRTLVLCFTMILILIMISAVSVIIARQKVIRVGVDGFSAPFSITNSFGDLSGYDVDIIKAIAKKLDYKIEFKIIAFTGLENNLNNRLVDVVLAPMDSNTPENQSRNIIYSKPYFFNYLTMMKIKGKEIKLNAEGDFEKNSMLCIPNKPFILNFVRTHYTNTILKIYNGSNLAIDALYENECDVIIDTKSSNEYYRTKHNLNKLEIKPIYSDDAYNHTYKIAMSIHRPDLFEQINKGLEHLIQTGEINKIHQKWFSSDYCKQ